MKRLILLLALCAAVLQVSAQTFVWKADLTEVNKEYEKLIITFIDSTKISISFPDSNPAPSTKIFNSNTSAVAKKWVERTLKKSINISQTDSIADEAFKAYHNWTVAYLIKRRITEYNNKQLAYKTYNFSASEDYSEISIAADTNNVYIWFENEITYLSFKLINPDKPISVKTLKSINKGLNIKSISDDTISKIVDDFLIIYQQYITDQKTEIARNKKLYIDSLLNEKNRININEYINKCNDETLFCKQYGYSSSNGYSIVTLGCESNNLYIWIEEDGYFYSHTAINSNKTSIQNILLLNNEKLSKKKISDKTIDSIATVFSKDIAEYYKKQNEEKIKKQKQYDDSLLNEQNKRLINESISDCNNGTLFCRQYYYSTNATITIGWKPNKLYVFSEQENKYFAYDLFNSGSDSILSVLKINNKNFEIASDSDFPTELIAESFKKDLEKEIKQRKENIEKQKRLDDARAVLEDMSVQRGVALSLFLGKPCNQCALPKVQMYKAKYKKVNRKSARRKPFEFCCDSDSDHSCNIKSCKSGLCKNSNDCIIKNVDSLTIDSVYICFANYLMTTVRVYTHENKSNKQHVFINHKPLSVSSPRSLEFTKNALLREEISKSRNSDVFFIYLKEIILIDPGKESIITDYIPKDTSFVLTSRNNNVRVSKPAPVTYFRVNVFSDLTGFIDNETPNGKFQTEITCIIPMRTRVSTRWPFNSSFSRSSTTFLKTFVPELCLSKLGDDNRLLPVKYDPLRGKAHVNHFLVFQHVNFWGGGRINIFTMEDRNQNSLLYFNTRFRYMRTQFADTVGQRDRIFSGLSVFYELELYYKRKMMRYFSIDLAFSAGLIKLFENDISLSYGTIYGDNRDNTFSGNRMPRELTWKSFRSADFSKSLSQKMIFTPMMILKYNKPGSAANGLFIRIAFPNSFAFNNGFLIAHFGYIRPLESLIRKKTEPSK